MSFSEFVKPYADGYEDFEVGGTPVTAAILNNNYDGFLLALNSWASDVETDIGQIETDVSSKSTVSISNLLQSGTRIGILTIDGTPYNLYAPSGGGGGSSVTWDQILDTGTKIAEIEIDGVLTDVYSPTPIDVEANPTGSSTAGNLTKLKVGDSIYSIPSGGSGSSVTWDQIQDTGTKIAEIEIDGVPTDVYSPTPIDIEANPTGSSTAGDLNKLKVGDSIYSIPSGSGTTVIANPQAEATDDLEKLQVGTTVYEIPSGGTGFQEVTRAEYDALTPAEKALDIVYSIIDENTGGGEGGGSSYLETSVYTGSSLGDQDVILDIETEEEFNRYNALCFEWEHGAGILTVQTYPISEIKATTQNGANKKIEKNTTGSDYITTVYRGVDTSGTKTGIKLSFTAPYSYSLNKIIAIKY